MPDTQCSAMQVATWVHVGITICLTFFSCLLLSRLRRTPTVSILFAHKQPSGFERRSRYLAPASISISFLLSMRIDLIVCCTHLRAGRPQIYCGPRTIPRLGFSAVECDSSHRWVVPLQIRPHASRPRSTSCTPLPLPYTYSRTVLRYPSCRSLEDAPLSHIIASLFVSQLCSGISHTHIHLHVECVCPQVGGYVRHQRLPFVLLQQ